MQSKSKGSGKRRMQEANTDTRFKKGQQDADFFKKLHKVLPTVKHSPPPNPHWLGPTKTISCGCFQS